ncbi:MAG: acyltransferase [Lachnospiraceae bacterium]|nr:acyltransferase [Lachnospiraceae bacterium]
MSDKIANNNRIESIQIIRIIAAVGIYILHTGFFGGYGVFGVEIFNVISGFLFMYTSQKGIEYRNDFLKKKIIRLVPVYWFYTIMAFVLIKIFPSYSAIVDTDVKYLIKSLCFIPFINSKGFDLPVFAPGWTLNYEMFFIIICFISLYISYRFRSLCVCLIIAFAAACGNIFSLPYELHYYFSTFMLEFCLGIISWYIIKFLKNIKSKEVLFKLVYAIAILVSFSLMVYFGNRIVELSEREIFIGIPAMIFFISFYMLSRNIKYPRFMISLGNCAYSFYMVEYFTAKIFKVVTDGRNDFIKIFILLLMLLITFIFSYISYNIIEVKFTNLLKSKIRKKIK